jgi:hypothetical protein
MVSTGAFEDRERRNSTKSGVWPDGERKFAGVPRRWSTLREKDVKLRGRGRFRARVSSSFFAFGFVVGVGEVRSFSLSHAFGF